MRFIIQFYASRRIVLIVKTLRMYLKFCKFFGTILNDRSISISKKKPFTCAYGYFFYQNLTIHWLYSLVLDFVGINKKDITLKRKRIAIVKCDKCTFYLLRLNKRFYLTEKSINNLLYKSESKHWNPNHSDFFEPKEPWTKQRSNAEVEKPILPVKY